MRHRGEAPESRQGRGMLVGRAAEMRELDDALGVVRTKGDCVTLTVLGAAGLGKSRLVREFLARQRDLGDAAPRVFRGSARESGGSFDAFARLLRHRFGLTDAIDAEQARALVRQEVAKVLDDRKVGDVVYFLGQILGLEFHDSPIIKAIEGDAAQLRLLRSAVIKRFLEADALAHRDRAPTILAIDDMHAAHDEALDLLEYLADSLSAPVLLIVVARPELLARRDGWTRHAPGRHRIVHVSPLSDTDAAAVTQTLLARCGEGASVDELVEAACALASGNPALLEQMVRIYVDAGVVEVKGEGTDDERWVVHVDRIETAELPLTVEDAVQARVAALSQAERETLERASVMGAVFWLGGLLAMGRIDQPVPPVFQSGEANDSVQLREILASLVERDYVLRLPDSAFGGDEEYVFKHNLEREAIARLLPPIDARRFHVAIADWLAFKLGAGTSEEYLGMLARHRELGGARTLAAMAYLDAANVARRRYSNARAVEYYARTLELVGEGAEIDADRRLTALHNYGDVLQLVGRTEEAVAVFREMLACAYRLDLSSKGGAAHSRLGRVCRDTGCLEEATQHLDAGLALFAKAEDERGVASALDDIGKLHWLRGDYPRALDYTKRALSMRRKLGDRRSLALSLNNLGLVYQDSGEFQKALDALEQALAIRREIHDLVGVAVTLNNLGTLAQDQRDDLRALSLFHEAHEIAVETGDRSRIALTLTNLGEAYSRCGDPVTAVIHLKKAEEIASDLGDKLGVAEAARGLGKAYLAQREWTRAREHTARAVECFSEVGSKVQLGIALRSLGEVCAAGAAGGKEAHEARDHLLRSVRIFGEIGNEVELARSCRAYAEMVRSTAEFFMDPEALAEADEYGRRADQTFEKLRKTTE